MKKAGVCLVAALALFGCATKEKYEAILQSWVGSHVDQLVMAWGPPQGSFTLSDGRTIIEYSDARTFVGGGQTYTLPETTYSSGSVYGAGNYGTYSGTTTTYTTHTTPTYSINLLCKTRLTISNKGIIESWAHQGNDCVARDSRPLKAK